MTNNSQNYNEINEITITQPDDFHIHLRNGKALNLTTKHACENFGKIIVMPNLKPPITTTIQASKYFQQIQKIANKKNFLPLMTLYLTDNTTTDEIIAAKNSGLIVGVKLYPAGATTNSDFGLTKIQNAYAVFEKMQELGLVLQIHGEVVDSKIDIFDREKVFIDTILQPLAEKFPNLKIVLEHITTKDAVDCILNVDKNIAATITPQHLMFNRNDLLVGGIKPHFYCLPILKSEIHRQALISAIKSANPKFFAGTDSAPHSQNNKENACGCAGCYSAYHAIELYAEIFDKQKVLHLLNDFVSQFGAQFYNLPPNFQKITLIKQQWQVPEYFSNYDESANNLIPLCAGKTLQWKIKNKNY